MISIKYGFRGPNFATVSAYFFACDFFKLFFKLVNFLTTLTNDDTRTGGGNGNGNQDITTFLPSKEAPLVSSMFCAKYTAP